MLFFRRIFKFKEDQVAQMAEHRLETRYTPGAAFPLHAYLSLGRYDWRPSKVLNLSGSGLGLLTARDAKAETGQHVRAKVVLGKRELELEGRLTYLELQAKGLYCGIGLQFADFLTQKSYLQLLQPVAIGQSLVAVPGDRVVQNEPQFIKLVFRGEGGSALTVWLTKAPGTPLHGFEFQMHDYFCRADVKSGVLEAFVREATDGHKGRLSNPVFDSMGGLSAEIRQLFHWILPNLSPAVPDDVRAFLQRFAA